MMQFSFIPIALLTLLGSAGAFESGYLRGQTIQSTSIIDSPMSSELLNQDQDKLSFMHFEIRDAKHDKELASAYNFNANVYHLQESYGERSDRWAFVPVSKEEGYYYIYDLRHYKALSAGDHHQDGNIYHVVPNGRDNAKWRVEPVPGNDGHFYFYDKMNGKSICGGDNYDGTIYHEAADGRENCQWSLLDPRKIDAPGSIV
jgi:hypothetical protein